jgi:hypothetical protein
VRKNKYPCDCGSTNWTKLHTVYENGIFRTTCDICQYVPGHLTYNPDVYFKEPYRDEHLADKEHPNGYYITSKRQKAKIMKKLNVREAGDRIRGARATWEGKRIKNYGEQNIKGKY